MNFSSVNTGTSIPAKDGYNIMVVAANNSFTANGISVPLTSGSPLILSHAPLSVTGNITNITAGSIFYYYEGNLSVV